MINFLEALRNRAVMGDGAIGTLLYQRGESLGGCFEALNLSRPEAVQSVHRDFLAAGAELIETNTFGANRFKLEKHGLGNEAAAINRRGAELAVAEARQSCAWVAGSVGPAGDGLKPENRTVCYREQMEALLSGGVDVLFLESFSTVSEICMAIRVAKEISITVPIIGSLSLGDDGHTADGFRINEAFARLREAGADVTGLNCQIGPMAAEGLLKELTIRDGDLVSVYPNAGKPQFFEGRFIYHPLPKYFAEFVPRLIRQGARLIGGCCGTTPETIRAMAEALRNLSPVQRKEAASSSITLSEPARRQSNPPPGSLLDVVGQRTLIVTELDPPKSLKLDKMIEGAKALREAGTDFVTLADNSLAILRVSNVAAGFLIKQETGLEPVIHLACRDKNLLGLQSELMGLHALGIHHVLALTGDPAKVGDHPGASNVYDTNSIGLIKTISGLNRGVAANGRDLKTQGRFVVGCAFNPNSRNIDTQVRKLEDKLKAGAHFVMTQPIFDPALARVTYEKTKAFGVPILMGVMPLLSSRNAEFLHNEVPGIVIPDSIRDRMRGKEGGVGAEEGLAVARELASEVLNFFKGIYLVTPLMRFDLTAQLSREIREQEGRADPYSRPGMLVKSAL